MKPRKCISRIWLAAFIVLLYLLIKHRANVRYEDDRLLNYRIPYCNCHQSIIRNPSVSQKLNSTCSEKANLRGPGQKIVSFSFYGDSSPYFQEIQNRADEIIKLYPGWVMRLYHNVRRNDSGTQALCNIICERPHIDDCYVDDLPKPIGPLSDRLGSIWRFMVLGDPLVDVFVSRDLDAVLGQREVDAVQQWIRSNYTWHVMRDHFSHRLQILAGLWGVKNTKDLATMTSLRKAILSQRKLHYRQFDQTNLLDVVWPIARNDLMAHDSYTCRTFWDTVPFPSQRADGFFVGNNFGMKVNLTCPEQCRPKDHKDWTQC